jgi:hypothetical protein
VNPIFLSETGKEPVLGFDCFPETCYCQKYNRSDYTELQIITPTTVTSVTAHLIDPDGRKIRQIYALKATNIPIKDISVYDLLVRFDVPEGYYRIMVEIHGAGITACTLYSDCLHIAENHECTTLIEYRNSENFLSTIFDTGITFAIRVEGGFYPKSERPESQDTQYQNELIDFTLLQSIPYSVHAFTAGGARGMPMRIMDRVNRAFSCNELKIKDYYWSKIEGAKFQATEADNYDLRTWTIDIAKKGRQDVYVASCGRHISCKAEWDGWSCRALASSSEGLLWTNVMEGWCTAFAAPDGTVYFYSPEYNRGIMKANGGDVLPTNITSGVFSKIVSAPDGTIYFLAGDGWPPVARGVFKKAPDSDVIVQTDIYSESWYDALLMPDGSILFAGDGAVRFLDGELVAHYEGGGFSKIFTINGVIYVSDGGNIYRFDPDSGDADYFIWIWGGAYTGIIPAPDGTVFLVNFNAAGITRLNLETGASILTNIADRRFTFGFAASDGNIYFGGNISIPGNSAQGIYMYDADTDAIVQTNITTDMFNFAIEHPDGSVFFGSNGSPGGLYKRPAGGGDIFKLNVDEGISERFLYGVIAADGTMFFGGGDEGGLDIQMLTHGSDTLITLSLGESYGWMMTQSGAESGSGVVYFTTNGEGIIKYVRAVPATETDLYPMRLIYQKLEGDKVVGTVLYSILDFINDEYIEMNYEDYLASTPEYVAARCAALLHKIEKCADFTPPAYNVIHSILEVSRSEIEIEWQLSGVSIDYVSTQNGEDFPIDVQILGDAEWLTVNSEGGRININVQTNSAQEERITEIEVKQSGNDCLSHVIAVKQLEGVKEVIAYDEDTAISWGQDSLGREIIIYIY